MTAGHEHLIETLELALDELDDFAQAQTQRRSLTREQWIAKREAVHALVGRAHEEACGLSLVYDEGEQNSVPGGADAT